MKNWFLSLVFITSGSSAFAQIHFFQYIDSLFQKKEICESLPLKQELQNAGYKLSGDDSLDMIVKKLAYMHMLLTCHYSVDGDTSGGFGIPYFWNYTDHNPREHIVNLKKGKPLNQLGIATQDRTPLIFWGDYMTDEPQYSYEHISAFYSFGWCSEREMAFKAWLGVAGISSKIGIKADHVWAEVELPGMPGYFLYIDNTFNRFEVWPESKRPPLEVGNKYIDWYNQQGSDKTIRKKLAAFTISGKRATELQKRIVNYFGSNSEDY
jgi:hypothetical protein